MQSFLSGTLGHFAGFGERDHCEALFESCGCSAVVRVCPHDSGDPARLGFIYPSTD
jgi:hypothetical protein